MFPADFNDGIMMSFTRESKVLSEVVLIRVSYNNNDNNALCNGMFGTVRLPVQTQCGHMLGPEVIKPDLAGFQQQVSVAHPPGLCAESVSR